MNLCAAELPEVTRARLRRPKAYSFARAGSLWMPKSKRECATLNMAFSPLLANLGTDDSPLTWPGNTALEAWYHWKYDRQYGPTLVATGTTPPAVTWTGTVPITCGLQVEITTGGARGTAMFRWSARNGDGTDWVTGVATAATVNLGNGITLAFPVGTYATDNVYKMVVSSWRDQSGKAHHWVSQDGNDSSSKNPIPLITPYGTALRFNGTNSMLRCVDTLGTNMVGGADHAFTAFAVLKLDTTTTVSGQGSVLFFGDGATNRGMLLEHLDATSWRMRKQDNAGSAVNVDGGTPNTSIHIVEFVQYGTTAEILIDGTSVVGPTAQDLGTLTVTTATIGASFFGGAEGNRISASYYEMVLYNTALTSGIRADVRSRIRAPYGF